MWNCTTHYKPIEEWLLLTFTWYSELKSLIRFNYWIDLSIRLYATRPSDSSYTRISSLHNERDYFGLHHLLHWFHPTSLMLILHRSVYYSRLEFLSFWYDNSLHHFLTLEIFSFMNYIAIIHTTRIWSILH